MTGGGCLKKKCAHLWKPFTVQVNPLAAFSDAFASRGAEWAKYAVSVGALSGMTTSLVCLFI